MKVLLLFYTTLLSSIAGYSQVKNSNAAASEKLSAGASLLFQNTFSTLTSTQKNQVYNQLSLKLSADMKKFIVEEFPVEAHVYPTDLNKDSVEEIFVVLGSSALFGNVGQAFTLFMKDKSGTYKRHQDFGPGMLIILTTSKQGYPELVIGGAGFEHPVVRWNGDKYVHSRIIKDGMLNEKNSVDVESHSGLYQKTKRKTN